MATSGDFLKGPEVNILLVGKTGSGKSKTGNTILQLKSADGGFKVGGRSSSVTTECTEKTATVGGRSITVVDTPGTVDTNEDPNHNKVLRELKNAMDLCDGDGYDAFLLVLRYPVRLTPEERLAVNMVRKPFGKNFGKYTIVLVAGGDQFYDDEEENGANRTFPEFIRDDTQESPKGLSSIIKDCSGQYVLFNNKERNSQNKQSQLKELFGAIDKVRSLQTRRYTKQDLADDSCFPLETMLWKFPGKEVPINRIDVGDLVLCLDDKGKSIFEEVYMIPHSDDNSLMEVVEIATKNHFLRVSLRHYLPVGNIKTYKFAENISVGDILFVNDISGNMHEEEVISVNKNIAIGKYNVFTTSGTLLVNGIAASCYEEHLHPKYAHKALYPLRCIHKIYPLCLEYMNKSKMNGMPTWIYHVKKILE